MLAGVVLEKNFYKIEYKVDLNKATIEKKLKTSQSCCSPFNETVKTIKAENSRIIEDKFEEINQKIDELLKDFKQLQAYNRN